MNHLDDFDIQILKQLEADGRMAYSAIATELGVSNTMVHQRITRLMDQGILTGIKPVLDEKNWVTIGELLLEYLLKKIMIQKE
ncbi:Lrp/AsnC family transcriptional regulator [Sphingobacterium sp. IITKGP-BTPF85]|uniref:Lrp/AsnC family transcriptional regulator n=1 Tax=Sphingobacterium sp. IITKGP-BTPF85 TaxID=1338009 RepID=UPI00041BF65F|nr:AsnC family transcriptional regulator [Sphingobacterium sp. IITKGP-BTPF85]KKX51093.1 hypothetical protein L950_0206920 [Sphingobacterium sp. IITKGP-BTPF85]